MNIARRLRFLHRAWRVRLRAERPGMDYLLGRDLEGALVADIGAHRGAFSYWMHKKVGPRGAVVAFEPQPELCAYLRDAKRGLRLDRLEVVEAALSSEAGTGTLLRPPEHWGGASLRVYEHVETEPMQVPMTTLDDHLLQHPKRPLRFIKCDVEGHEHDVFRGGGEILTADKPDLLFESFEVDLPHPPTFEYLNEIGYEGFLFFESRLEPIARYRELRPALDRKAIYNFAFMARDLS